MQKIDLGCGKTKKPGYVGIDIIDHPDVDIVHDLSERPWPVASDIAHDVWVDNVLEHFSDCVGFLNEVYRICASGAMVRVRVPYGRSHYATIDPTHRSFFSLRSFDYFDRSKEFGIKYGYCDSNFQIIRIIFDPEMRDGSLRYRRAWIWQIAKHHPDRYEQYLAGLFPLHSLEFVLRVVK